MSCTHVHNPRLTKATSLILQPKRPDGLPKGTFEVDFWSQDMVNLLSNNVKLRQELGKCFEKNEGSEGIYALFV